MKLRQGRRNGRNLYLQLGDNPTEEDPSVGFCLSADIADDVVRAANAGLINDDFAGDEIGDDLLHDVAAVNFRPL